MNIDIIFKIAAVGFLVAILCEVLKRSGREDMAMVASIAGLAIVLVVVAGLVAELFASVKLLFQLS